MSSSGIPGASASLSARERDVIDFLRANPAFLDGHPELLRQLAIPHDSGDAVSLLERQVAVLREDNARLKQRLDELIRLARRNQDLHRKLQTLVLGLMHAVGPPAIFAALERALREDFGAEFVTTLIFATPSFIDGAAQTQFAGAGAPARAAFAEALAARRPHCGELAAAQLAELGGVAGAAHSGAVVPLVAPGWDGVLVIASLDPTRYTADIGTEFLAYLAEIVVLVLEPWIKRERGA
jgi:uncharacterized protein